MKGEGSLHLKFLKLSQHVYILINTPESIDCDFSWDIVENCGAYTNVVFSPCLGHFIGFWHAFSHYHKQ